MSTITTNDGTTIYYKDWGSGQPIVFSHGWPLSSDDWDAQMQYSASMDFVASRMTEGVRNLSQSWIQRENWEFETHT
jgi:non-heme chloroperoxidase